MPSVMLVDGTDLAAWANRRDAQEVLPQLLRRLVHATVRGILRVGFPAGEGVQLGGWDGVVVVEQGNAFVPDGTSVWELSTNQDVGGKANSDYEKRLADPRGIEAAQSHFVFVTARRWGRKNEWANARRGEGVWRDVRAYDADDLEAWLELAPAVHVWISILLGKHPEDAVDLRNFWADWSEATRPATTSDLILAGRQGVVERVHAWLREPPAAPLAPFERACIASLAQAVPRLEGPLGRLRDRITDLLPIVRDHVYHPGFLGSFSIKDVLPALVPDLGYDDLDIQDGETASAALEAMLLGGDSMQPAERRRLRLDLLKYCARDTLAMVRVYQRLYELARRSR